MFDDLSTRFLAVLNTLIAWLPALLLGGVGLLCVYGLVRLCLYIVERGNPVRYAAFAERLYATRTVLHIGLVRGFYRVIFGCAGLGLLFLLGCSGAAVWRMLTHTDAANDTPFGPVDVSVLAWAIWAIVIVLLCVQCVMLRRIPLDIHRYGQTLLGNAEIAKIRRGEARAERVAGWQAQDAQRVADAARAAAEDARRVAERAYAKKELAAQKETQRNLFAAIRQSSFLATRRDATLTLPNPVSPVSVTAGTRTAPPPEVWVTGYVRVGAPAPTPTVAPSPTPAPDPEVATRHAAEEQQRQQADAERVAEEQRQQQAAEEARVALLAQRRAERAAISATRVPEALRLPDDITPEAAAASLACPIRRTDPIEGEL